MKRLVIAAVVLALIAGGLGIAATLTAGGDKQPIGRSATGPYRGSEPPGINLLPRFALPSYRGGVIRSTRLKGRVVLTTFVDTACTESCPIIVGILGRALPRLSASERRQVTALAISVNPRSDTPAHIQRFLRERGALGTLNYLVAPVARMRPVWKSFHVLSAVESGNADIHSADVRIFNRRGVWVSNMNAGVDLTVANLLHDIRQALGNR